MNPQVGDIWAYHHPYRDTEDAIVLIHQFLGETFNLSNKVVLTYWGYDLLTGQYDEWLFPKEGMEKFWSLLA